MEVIDLNERKTRLCIKHSAQYGYGRNAIYTNGTMLACGNYHTQGFLTVITLQIVATIG